MGISFQMFNDNLIVKRTEIEEATESGIIMPVRPHGDSDSKARVIICEVVQSPGLPTQLDDGQIIKMAFDPEFGQMMPCPMEGEHVATYDHLLTPCRYKGANMELIRLRHILAKVNGIPKPEKKAEKPVEEVVLVEE